MRLFHVSEDGAIGLFEPRPSRYLPDGVDVVWAISEDKLANYLLPRECPRVCFEPLPVTPGAPFGELRSRAPRAVAIESAWFERAQSTPLFLYEMPTAGFSLFQEEAGYWIARDAAVPVNTAAIGKPLTALINTGAELRVLPSLWELRDTVILAGVPFSMIRMCNAHPREV